MPKFNCLRSVILTLYHCCDIVFEKKQEIELGKRQDHTPKDPGGTVRQPTASPSGDRLTLPPGHSDISLQKVLKAKTLAHPTARGVGGRVRQPTARFPGGRVLIHVSTWTRRPSLSVAPYHQGPWR